MLGAAALSFPSLLVPGSQAQQLRERASSRRSFEVASVESTTLKVPYREIPNRAMSRELPHWKWTEILEVRVGMVKPFSITLGAFPTKKTSSDVLARTPPN